MGDRGWVMEFQLSVDNQRKSARKNSSRRYSQKKPSQIVAEKNQRKSAFLNLRKSARKNSSRRYSQKKPSQIVAENGGCRMGDDE